MSKLTDLAVKTTQIPGELRALAAEIREASGHDTHVARALDAAAADIDAAINQNINTWGTRGFGSVDAAAGRQEMLAELDRCFTESAAGLIAPAPHGKANP